jgi:hypothetical protein
MGIVSRFVWGWKLGNGLYNLGSCGQWGACPVS